jgi:predicted Zn finger-like uncharacterized protein
MALATRCPNCQAMFRVVSDQLKLRGGLVRCGSCRHVFDAISSLSYIEDAALTAAPPAATAAATPTPPATSTSTLAAAVETQPSVAARSAEHTTGDAHAAEDRAANMRGTPGTRAAEPAPVSPPPAEASVRASVPEAVGARSNLEPSIEPSHAAPVPAPIDPLAVPTLLAAKGEAAADEPVEEIIVRPADEPVDDTQGEADAEHEPPAAGARKPGGERTRPTTRPEPADTTGDEAEQAQAAFLRESRPKRGFSLVYGGGSLLLALAMLLQLAVVFRTELLIRWPELRPRLASICELYGCTVGWPTRAEQLAVIGTELQAVPGTDILELTAVVRNRASFRMSLPAVEVTLTDTTNRTLARKVFAPVDYLASSGEPSSRLAEGIGPGSDLVVRIVFEARGLNAAGFVVYPFYL